MAKSYDIAARAYGEKYREAQVEAEAAVKAARDSGLVVREGAVRSLASQIASTGEFDLTPFVEEPQAEQPVLPTAPSPQAPRAAQSAPATGIMGRLSAAGDVFSASRELADVEEDIVAERTKGTGTGLFRDIVADRFGIDTAQLRNITDIATGRDIPGAIAAIVSPEYAKARMEQEEAVRQRNISALQARKAELEQELGTSRAAVGEGSILDRLARVGGSVAATPEQAIAPIAGIAGAAIGGPVGATVAAGVGSIPLASELYDASIAEALDMGATADEAKDYARILTAVEFGFESAAGGLIGPAVARFGLRSMTKEAAKEALDRTVRSRLGRVASATAIGGVGEGATTLATEGASNIMEREGIFESPDAIQNLSKHNAELAVNRLDNVIDSTMAGVGISGTAATPAAVLSYAAEQGQRSNATLTDGLAIRDRARRNAGRNTNDQPRTSEAPWQPKEERPVEQPDMFGTPEGLPSVEEFEANRQRELEMDAAYNVNRRQAQARAGQEARAANREELLTSVANRVDTARQAEEALQDQVESGDTSPATLNALAAATRARVEAEAEYSNLSQPVEAEAPVEAPRQTVMQEPVQQELALPVPPDVQQVQARRQKVREQEEKTRKNQTTQERKAETTRRNQVTDRIIRENPNADDSEIARMVSDEMSRPAAPEGPNIVQDAATVVNRAKANENRKETTARRRRIDALRKQNPQATPEQLAEMYERENNPELRAVETPPPARQPEPRPASRGDTSGVTNNDELADMANRMGLESRGRAPREQQDEAQFRQRFKRIVDGLVSRNDQPSSDILNLIRTGRLIVARNSAELGRGNKTSEAEYDMDSGQMYLYTDNIDPKRIPEALAVAAAAMHEGGHSLQGNRPDAMDSAVRFLVGGDGYDAINNRLRQLAAQGNQIARDAVERADDAAAKASEGMRDVVAAREPASYFITEAVERRGKGLGRLAGTWNDIQAKARATMRDRFGMDLPINFAELEAATQKVAGEVLRTEQRGENTDGNLEMIAGRSHPRFAEFEEQGLTFTGPDGVERMILSDADSTFKWSGGIHNDLREGRGVKVSRLLNNPTIDEAYPELNDVDVFMDTGLSEGAAWFEDGGERELRLSPKLVNNINLGDHEGGHDIILHELQHGIQGIEGMAVGGTPVQFRTDADRRNVRLHRNTVREYDRVMNEFRGDNIDGLGLSLEATNDARMLFLNLRDGVITSREFAAEVSELINTDPGANRHARKLVRDMNDTINAYADSLAVMDEMNKRTMSQYMSLQGEQDAYFVQENRTVPQEELPQRVPYQRETLVTNKLGDSNPRSVTLEQRRGPTREVQGERRAAPWLTGLISPSMGQGKVVNAIMEYARTSASGDVEQALQNSTIFNRALGNVAADRGTTPKAMLKEIGAKIDAIDFTANDYEANRNAYVEAVREYGEAGEALINLRDQVDKLSREIIRQRSEQGGPLTPEERRAYGATLANMGNYVHRMYASQAGEAGRKYSERVWQDYKEGTNPENKKLVSNAIDYLVDNSLYIPDESEIGRRDVDTLSRLVSTYGLGNPDALTREQMEDALLNAREAINGDSDRIRNVAEEIVQELLGLSEQTSPITNYYRGARRNDGILKERGNFPEPLRALVGEIKHPAGILMVTAAKQAQFVARNRALLELKELSDSGQLSDNLIAPDTAGTPEAQGMITLEGPTWGPLQGYKASPNMNALLSDVTQQLATFEQAVAMAATRPGILSEAAIRETLGAWGTAAAFSKGMQVIGNPINFAYNFAGAPRMLLSNGNISPTTWGRAIQSAWQLISSAYNPESSTPESRRLIKAGVTDSARIGEIANTEHRQLRAIMKQMSGQEPSKIWEAILSTKDALLELYAMMDVWGKIANFYDNVDYLTKLYEAEGIIRPPERIDREAADLTNRSNVTYKRAAPVVKAIERSGLAHFLTYFWESFRADAGTALVAIEHIRSASNFTSPEAKRMARMKGGRMLIGLGSAWVLTGAVVKGLAEMTFGEDEDDRWNIRALLPEWVRNQDFIPVGKDENDKVVFFQWDRIDPAGPSTDLMRMIMNDKDVGADDIAKHFLDLYVAPRIGAQLISVIAAAAGNRPTREPTVQQLLPDAYSEVSQAAYTATGGWRNTENVLRAVVNSAEAFAPGWLGAMRTTNASPEAEDFTSATFAALRLMGARMFTLDPSRASIGAAIEYKDEMRSIRSAVSNMVKDHGDSLSENQVISRLTDLRAREIEAYEKVNRLYRGMRATGMSSREAKAVLKDQQVPTEVLAALGTERRPERVLSKQSFDTQMKNQMRKAATEAEREEIRTTWTNAWEMLEGANRNRSEE